MKRENSRLLAAVIQEYIKEMQIDDGLFRVRIFNVWDLIVGERAAKATTSKFFKDGTLFCTVNSSMLRTQLLFRREDIIAQINKMLSQECVKNLVIR